jgi:hypothetical protein
VCLPGSQVERYYTAAAAPASGDLIALDHDGEQVRVIEVHTDGKGGWIVYAAPLADGEDIELHSLDAAKGWMAAYPAVPTISQAMSTGEGFAPG